MIKSGLEILPDSATRVKSRGATDMGTRSWAHSIDTPGAYSGEAHEELKVWKHPKPRNQIRKGPLGKPT